VRVAAQTLGSEVTIHVEDDGCGVPADAVERVFTAGWSGRGGTGLGLYAVATTVAAHAGRVRCVPLARGSRFSITLPLLAAHTLTA
jgi:signal transduction histidine kinase